MRISFLGNFGPPHSTERHLARALIANGHKVLPIQEGETAAMRVADHVAGCDLFLWTQTYSLANAGGTVEERAEMVHQVRRLGVPSVGYHLDRWWGLSREGQVREEPFFHVDLVVTADGGHDEQWAEAGVNHRWLPPAVSAEECAPGTYRPDLAVDVAFVGSWHGYGHPEWTHRAELVDWLRNRYGGRLGLWPIQGTPAVRGEALRDLYASTKVNVGDSCLVGSPRRYWSDRIPETLGRGGLLLHPRVEGLEEEGFIDGETLGLWTLGDWEELACQIDCYLADDARRSAVAEAGRALVLERHTYEVRVRQLCDLLREEEGRL